MARLRLAEQFVEDVATVYSPRLRNRIVATLKMLASFPESGAPVTSPSLVREFGCMARTCSVSPYVLVYEYSADQDVVDVHGLVPSRIVR